MHQLLQRMLLLCALAAPSSYNHAAEKQSDQLDKLLQSLRPCQYSETNLQKSVRLTKEYGPFAASVVLGIYITYTSMQQQAHRIIPELAISSINAYALYKSHTMTKQWLKQLPTERTFPFQLSLPCVTAFATYFYSSYFFKPSYIATLSSFLLFATNTFNFINAHQIQHRNEESIINDTATNITNLMLNQSIYCNFKKKEKKQYELKTLNKTSLN